MSAAPSAKATLVVGLGDPNAGDDAVGALTLDALEGTLGGVALLKLRNAADLLTALDGAGRVVLVDALVGGELGQATALALNDVAERAAGASSHGISLASALALLAKVGQLPEHVVVVGVGVEGNFRIGTAPSAAARLGAERAAALVRQLVQNESWAARSTSM